ncbi:PREDICTED: uncharacterized protein LOC107336918 isoform X2 [Acropora digitifera]|uniref:uncharacterized protein LOC107336918 isoform X2 n=1 Tax=Acropora digitifera TaxID=70779 RepID=UPI00077AB805|nr:PREDICTED: uncharacterized protein LOC107336918 isoform X2 [Acropora digitifera]
MAVSNGEVARARVLAFIHIVVGALLIIFGIVDAALIFYGAYIRFLVLPIVFGIWTCITGGLGIPASSPQRTSKSNCFAGLFMGFSITSAVMAGIMIICYSIVLAAESSYSYYYECGPSDRVICPTYSYGVRMGLATVILILGIIEFVIGIWVSICLCLMKSCCTDPQQAAGINALSQVVDGVPVVVPLQGPGVTIQTQPFYGYPPAGQTTIGGPVHFQAVGKQPQLVVVPSPGGDIPPQYTERSQQVPQEEPILTPQTRPCSNTGSSRCSYSITSLV